MVVQISIIPTCFRKREETDEASEVCEPANLVYAAVKSPYQTRWKGKDQDLQVSSDCRVHGVACVPPTHTHEHIQLLAHMAHGLRRGDSPLQPIEICQK